MSFAMVEKLTFLLLVGFFVFSEIYMAKRQVWGIITKIAVPPLPFADLALKELEVRLHDGETISVQASPCAFCLGRYSVGDQVGVTKLGGRYYVCASLLPHKRKGSGGLQACAVKRERRWLF